MLFDSRDHQAIAEGRVTATFRRWTTPKARAGGAYRLGTLGRIRATAVRQVTAESLTDEDARAAGHASAASLLASIEHYAKRPLAPSDVLTRVDFVFEPEPVEPSGAGLTVQEVLARLERLDARSTDGPWTDSVLALIGGNPHVVSTELAGTIGMERFEFKEQVRKLKALGLTESFEVGYGLTPLGWDVLARSGVRPPRW